MSEFPRITRNPAVMGGKACIRGMRVTVGMIVGQLAAGVTIDELLDDYPYIEREDVMQALKYAAWLAQEREIHLDPRGVKFVVDMNLSPKWVQKLRSADHDAIHWSSVGEIDAPDETLAEWARSQAHVVLTADLDFGSLLAASGAGRPSVVQLRSSVLRVSVIGEAVIKAIASASDALDAGAFMSFDDRRVRVRRLPFSSDGGNTTQSDDNASSPGGEN